MQLPIYRLPNPLVLMPKIRWDARILATCGKKVSHAASNSGKDPSICQTLPSCDVSTNTLDEMALLPTYAFSHHASVENGVVPAQWKGKNSWNLKCQPPGSAQDYMFGIGLVQPKNHQFFPRRNEERLLIPGEIPERKGVIFKEIVAPPPWDVCKRKWTKLIFYTLYLEYKCFILSKHDEKACSWVLNPIIFWGRSKKKSIIPTSSRNPPPQKKKVGSNCWDPQNPPKKTQWLRDGG